MSGKYYYLIASLPGIQFGEKLPITSETFLSKCGQWLAKEDYRVLEKISINNYEINRQDPAILKEYKRFNAFFNSQLAAARHAHRQNLHERIPHSLNEVYRQENPLKMEYKLEEIRWQFLDEKEFGHYFDLERLILYYLKLQINQRLFAFNKEKGMRIFESLSEVKNEPC